jgi:hypothetical protein
LESPSKASIGSHNRPIAIKIDRTIGTQCAFRAFHILLSPVDKHNPL